VPSVFRFSNPLFGICAREENAFMENARIKTVRIFFIVE
jgi:hypothetical protein